MNKARENQLSLPAFGGLALTLLAILVLHLALGLFALLATAAFDDGYALGTARVLSNLELLTLAQLASMGLSLWLGLRWFGGDQSLYESLSLYAIRGRTAALCLLAGACLQFPLTELANLLHHYVLGPESLERQLALQQLIEAPSLGGGLLVVTCIVAVVPIVEELFFRGLILFGLRARYGDAAAVVGSACLFGISHLHAVTAVYATVAGLVLGLLALRTRSIWPGIAVHAAVNAMPVLLSERVFPMRGFNVPSVVPLHLPLGLVLGSLLVGFLLLAWAVKVEYGDAA